jgi:hypothetical protein
MAAVLAAVAAIVAAVVTAAVAVVVATVVAADGTCLVLGRPFAAGGKSASSFAVGLRAAVMVP